MSDGSVLRRGYVPVEPDTSGFDDKLREQFRKSDPGGKAGKQLGGQLNRALKRLDLDPVDVKADPKQALAAIAATEAKLRDLAGSAETVEVKVQTERALAQINRFKKQLGDVGDQVGPQIGDSLNQALNALDVDGIDITADARQAKAEIRATEERLDELARSATSVEVRVKTQQAIGELAKFKKQLGDVGEEGATGFAARFSARIGPMLASAPMGPPLVAAAAIAAPAIAATVAGALVGAAGAGGVIGGVTLAARDDRVKLAGRELGQFLIGDLERRSAGFVDPVLRGIDRIRLGWQQMGPDLDQIFKSSRFVEPLIDGAIKGAKGFVSGFSDAVDQADPVITAFSVLVSSLGTSVGGLFRLMGEDAKAGASAINDLNFALNTTIEIAANVLHAGANVKSFTDAIDTQADAFRYWLEDSAPVNDTLAHFGLQLDLTADGFSRGSVEAEAYRKATLGTADAADFATLKAAGMADADIARADASGTYRVQLDELTASTRASALAAGTLVASSDDVAEVQKTATLVQQEYTRSIENMAPAGQRTIMLVDGLKKATQQLYGAQEQAIDANEAYEASWDALSESVKKNGGSLDVHTAKGRANRDALQNLLTTSRDMYIADINSGVAIDEARKKHEKRTAAVKDEATKVGLNKTETGKLISTYGKIPPKKETDVILDGVKTVVNSLKELYVYQRSLAEGIPLKSARALLTAEAGPQNAGKGGGGYHEGGWTGPGPKMQKAGDVHADEFVIKKSSRRRIEARNPGLLDEMNATGQVPGYAGGGLVAPVETRNFRIGMDARDTRLPSKAEVAKAVAPVFGDWPSSPASQRGDSGVWKKVLQLIKSGPKMGSFGNSYRPGDPKWHGSGRAVDWMGFNMDPLAQYLASKRPLELIHRTNKRDYAYTRGVNKGSFNEALMNAHRNHIHIAMAQGGVIGEPVAGVGMRSGNSYSFGERGPETVTPGVGGPGETHFHAHFHDSVITTKQQAAELVAAGWKEAKNQGWIR